MIQEILLNKKEEVTRKKENYTLAEIRREVDKMLGSGPRPREFKNSLIAHKFSIIAEIKRKSPSHGDLKKDLDVIEVARAYEQASGVSCISVLTDHKYFGGTLADLKLVRSTTKKPVLRKEFILDEYQVYESRKSNADAMLLISTILEKEQLNDLIQLTRYLGMEPLVECHSTSDLEKIPFKEVDIIGINSRDLIGTLETDLSVIEKMLPLIPPGKVVIAESGVHTASDIKWLNDLGVNAVLIGAGILANSDLPLSIQQLLSSV